MSLDFEVLQAISSILIVLILCIAGFIIGYSKFIDPPKYRRKGVTALATRDEGLWLMVAASSFSIYIILLYTVANSVPYIAPPMTTLYFTFLCCFSGILCFRNLLERTKKVRSGRKTGAILISLAIFLFILSLYFCFD